LRQDLAPAMRFMQPLLDLTTDDLAAWLAQRGQPAYRARQVRRWIFERRAGGFEEMTDLPLTLRSALAGEFLLFTGTVVRHQQAADGTEKLLVQWPDGHTIECVLLRDRDKRTICISTQVGCAMGCVFCASGLEGVARNLTRGEIVEQMLLLQRLLPANERLSHIVVMGMGEPLANLRHLLPALAEATVETGLGISARRVTISTVGLPEGLRRLAEEDIPFHLAVSLHAPNDLLRNQLVPVNRNIGIAAVLEAADAYFRQTGRRVTFEYVLLADVNDRPEHARQLAALLRERCALLNVIPYNPVAGLPYRTPRDEALGRFVEIVEQAGIPVKVRRRRGDRFDAACGQLRRAAKTASPSQFPLPPGDG
jgi:23S rRNA (adenine2503-C2)-methyltransferase